MKDTASSLDIGETPKVESKGSQKTPCGICGKTNHATRNCKQRETRTTGQTEDKLARVECYRCGQFGHYANKCTEKRGGGDHESLNGAMSQDDMTFNKTGDHCRAKQKIQGAIRALKMSDTYPATNDNIEEFQCEALVDDVPSTDEAPFFTERQLEDFLGMPTIRSYGRY